MNLGNEEEWVKSAMTDDAMVVEILFRLHNAPTKHTPAPAPLGWTVRQRRSKHASKNPAHRASPTTPLSWSGGAISGADGGLEESSKPSSNLMRSKVNGNGEKTAFKRSQKKKTLASLKEDESYLVKERRELKRDISVLRINLEKQRAENESLKRMKIEQQPLLNSGRTSIPEEAVAASEPKFVLPDLNLPFEESDYS